MKRSLFILAAVLFLPAVLLCAEVRIPSVFSDHMVLQRDTVVPVWGWASPGEQIVVSINEQSVTATAGDDGYWRIDLQPMKPGGPFALKIEGRFTDELFSDVLVGDVWLCAGQSNMDFQLYKSDDAQQALAQTRNYPNIRLFKVARHIAISPQSDCQGRWKTNTPENAREFSAVGYYFGQKLNAEINVPIGLIHSAYGGTPAEAWTSHKALQAESSLATILDNVKKKQADYDLAMQQWHADSKTAKADGTDPPSKPALSSYTGNHRMPTGLFNGMVHPLIPYGIRGVIWYQGEANTWRSYQYRTLLPTMIKDWRVRWGRGDFHFGIVQISNYFDPRFPPSKWSWPELREAQLMTAQSLPNTGLIVTIDVGNPTDIHPTDKKTVGDRLAQWALSTTYDREMVPSGPMYRQAEFKDGKVIIHFDHVGAGLATRDGGPVRGLVIAQKPGEYRWATARIVGDTLVVKSDRYKSPQSVRYGWAGNPEWSNLINKEGLPASPFRTDDWASITAPDQ